MPLSVTSTRKNELVKQPNHRDRVFWTIPATPITTACLEGELLKHFQDLQLKNTSYWQYFNPEVSKNLVSASI